MGRLLLLVEIITPICYDRWSALALMIYWNMPLWTIHCHRYISIESLRLEELALIVMMQMM